MYYNYFSKGHNKKTTLVLPFSALWQTLTLPPMEKISEQMQSVPIYHNVNGSYHYNDQIFSKVIPETNIVISLWKHICLIKNDKIQSKTHYTLVKI